MCLIPYRRAADVSYAGVPQLRARWPLAAALFVTLFGALLRLDAFTQKYGTLDHPAWARFVTQDVAAFARHVRPADVHWGRVPQPYVGGDPIAYLKYAREMTSFYQPHVREPAFLATIRAALWTLDGQDAAVSLASALGSLLAIFGTYLLGARLLSPVAGLIAAALMAAEYQNITWAVDGWRDDLFTGMFVLTVWAIVRFRDRPSFGGALLLGSIAGGACLTRITSLSFVVPGLVWVAMSRPEGRRPAYLVTAIAIMTAVVAPYLISCAIGAGDPFFSLNDHTIYYRFAEGVRDKSPLSATEYIRQKIAARPIAMLDVGVTGLFVHPFQQKWSGFDPWLPALGWFLWAAAPAGLAIWIFSSRGRLMLLMLVTSLVPYAFTWNLGSGGDWRFTMHAYPIYLLAAMHACTVVMMVIRQRTVPMPALAIARRGAAVAGVFVVAAAAYLSLPWFVAREGIAHGEAVTISPGERDRVFYRTGWSAPRTDGNVTARVSEAEQTAVHFPLTRKRSYDVILRMDPVQPDAQQRVTVLFNRQLLGRLQLSWNPERVGSYRLSLPIEWVRPGGNEITLVPEALVAAGSAGPNFAWLDPATKVGVRFWYVRVLE
jgi:Dolichyl-phosphate-mannose-protein mannosyltransferase